MKQYLDYLQDIQENGVVKADRTGTGTRSLFGRQLRFDLKEGFPLLTTKKVWFKGVAVELLWFLRGDTNIEFLHEHSVHIWDEWADEDGELGPVYGSQWRRWQKPFSFVFVDQISEVIEQLRTSPDSRRLIVNAWNVGELEYMALPPCHVMFQFWTREMTYSERYDYFYRNHAVVMDWMMSDEDFDHLGVPRRYISCQMYQRSVDSFLGLPFNIASYALITHMIGQQVNMVPDELIWVGGDCHIYLNHKEQVAEQLTRDPRALPTLRILRVPPSIDDYKLEDFELVGYDPHPAIKADISV